MYESRERCTPRDQFSTAKTEFDVAVVVVAGDNVFDVIAVTAVGVMGTKDRAAAADIGFALIIVEQKVVNGGFPFTEAEADARTTSTTTAVPVLV